jgi:hypothetical protein
MKELQIDSAALFAALEALVIAHAKFLHGIAAMLEQRAA